MTPNEKIEKLIAPAAKDMGLSVVQARFEGRTLSLLLERENGESPTIEECEKASREFSALLDVADLIGGRYFLEVGSAGMDRPLLKPEDFARFIGRTAKVELKTPAIADGRRSFKGKIESANGDDISAGGIPFKFGDILKARLVATDEEIKQILKARKEGK